MRSRKAVYWGFLAYALSLIWLAMPWLRVVSADVYSHTFFLGSFVMLIASGMLLARWRALWLTGVTGVVVLALVIGGDEADRAGEVIAVSVALSLMLVLPLALGIWCGRGFEETRSERSIIAPSEATTHVTGRRVLAHIADSWIVLFLVYSLEDLIHGWEGSYSWSARAAVVIAYFSAFHARIGVTPGKAALGLRVVTADGQVPGPRAAVLRSLTLLVELFGLIGLIGVLRHPLRQRLGDRLAKTYVVGGPRAVHAGEQRAASPGLFRPEDPRVTF